MNKKITIIDYQSGNLFSVVQMFKNLGSEVIVTSNPSDILHADAVVLPGVGAFGAAMKNLEELGLAEKIKAFVNEGKPFMGICLGLQLLFEESEEFEIHKGLGLVNGRVIRFPEYDLRQNKIRIPQISWNTISKPNGMEWDSTPLKGLENETDMYFVHSFFVIPTGEVTLSLTEYEGVRYTSSILKDNIFACQFHPEKSGKNGILIYENWLTLNNLK